MKLFRVLAPIALAAFVVTGCSSSKQTTIEGYPAQELNRKRVAVLLPAAEEITFTNAELFASSRGVAGASAGETFDSELRTVLVAALQSRLDSNSILNYVETPAAGIVPLRSSSDFTATGPVSWSEVKRAGQEAAVDFLLVLRDVRVGNTGSSDPRGNESVSAAYSLLDIRKQTTVTSGTLGIDASAPRTPAMTHERLAAELTAKLPFTVVEE